VPPPLAYDAPRCVRCKTRYCNSTCQHDHWRRGHKQIYKKIHRGGNAEQYHAENKYKAAVAVAVEACAEDTKGQTCYICTEALHWKKNEGLVRGCACRGTAGFAHVSCLMEQPKILVAEGEENNLDDKAWNARWDRWQVCGLCEQQYHGFVACALGWACWKTYVGRPEGDFARSAAITELGNELSGVGNHENALAVDEARLSMLRRIGASEENMLVVQGNLAMTYEALGRLGHAILIKRDVYLGRVKLNGEGNAQTLLAANNYALSLCKQNAFEEAKLLMQKCLPAARRLLGESDETTLRNRLYYAEALYRDDCATLDDLREAVTTLEGTEQIGRRVFGGAHPTTVWIGTSLRKSREALRARETPPTSA